MKAIKTIAALSISLLIVFTVSASNITIRSYDNTNVIVETTGFTSAVSNKVTIDNVTKTLHDVKIYSVSGAEKTILFVGDIELKGRMSAEAVAFPFNMVLVKETYTETTVVLKAADVQDINNLITNLKGIRNEANRLDKFKDYLNHYSFNTAQLAAVLSIFTFEEIKANLAIMSYDNLQDKGNFMRLYALLMNAPYDTDDKMIE